MPINTWLSPCRALIFSVSCQRQLLSRLYSTRVSGLARSKWSLEGVPRPKSILEDDNAEVDLSEDDDIVNGVHPDAPLPHKRKPPQGSTPYEYKEHRKTLQKLFPGGWSPPKKLSREAMDGLRQLHRLDPEKFNTPVLAEKFRISPEAVRRILKSKWEPPREKTMKLVEKERQTRGERIRSSRSKEMREARDVEEFKRATETPVGKSIKDGFTFA